MIRVQQEYPVHCLGDDRIDLVVITWCGKHHVKEILGIGEIVAWVNEWLTHGILVTHRGQRRHFGDQPVRSDDAVIEIIDVQRIVIESGEGAGDTTHGGRVVGYSS